jgi:hypothetical protein
MIRHFLLLTQRVSLLGQLMLLATLLGANVTACCGRSGSAAASTLTPQASYTATPGGPEAVDAGAGDYPAVDGHGASGARPPRGPAHPVRRARRFAQFTVDS